MHILITANNFFPDPGSGGSGRVISEIGKRLQKRGHHISVITIRRGDASLHSNYKGIEVWRYDSGYLRLPFVFKRIRNIYGNIVANRGVDLVNFHGPFTSFMANHLIEKSKPRIYTFHNPWPKGYRIKMQRRSRLPPPLRNFVINLNVKLREMVENRIVETSDRTIVLSEYMKNELKQFYKPSLEPKIIPGGVDTRKFNPNAGAPPEPIDGNKLNFLTVRRLAPRMGLTMLLEAFSGVADKMADARLFIAGDGPLRNKLEERAVELDIDDKVVFLGFVEEGRLPRYYAHSDIFVLPTTSLEGFGLVTLEAMASGTPVIGTSVGGTKEILGGFKQELLVKNLDPNSLEAKILQYSKKGKQELRKLGEDCRRYAEQYSWEKISKKVEAMYFNLL